MEGKALVWFQELRTSNNLTTWSEFIKALQIRFGRGSYDDPMETLVKLKQTGSIEEYKSQFELLANRVVGLLDNLKLSCFLGGLSDEIRLPVRMFNPRTLTDAYSLAKIQEELILNTKKTTRTSWSSTQLRSSNMVSSSYNPRMSLQGPSKMLQGGFGHGQPKGGDTSRALVPVQKVPSAQMEDRRKKGLCYSCDAKWSKGHVCEGLKLLLIEEVLTDEIEKNDDATLVETVEEEPEISLNAITGTPTPKTMRLIGRSLNHKVIVLIDSGSTHNFVDVHLANLLGIQPKGQEAIKVRIANGQEVTSSGKSSVTTLKLQGTDFGVYVIPLAGCDLVLGIQWLRLLGPILWDFEALKMEFSFNNRKCLLRGFQQGQMWSLEDAESFRVSGQKGVLFQLMAHSAVEEHPGAAEEYRSAAELQKLEELLQQFSDVFEEPTKLPPHRAHDHAIKLQPGVKPVSVRPYRYPFYQRRKLRRL